jgi:CAP-Gly domain-containing linker protein 1
LASEVGADEVRALAKQIHALNNAMATTPGKPRMSGIPAPAKASSIPTPGRLRSVSSASTTPLAAAVNPSADHVDSMRAFQDAIKANNPAQHRTSAASTSDLSSAPSLSPESKSFIQSQSGRRSVAGRSSSVASSTSTSGSTPAVPRYSTGRTKTPNPRPSSRTSDVFMRSSSRAADRPFEIGDNVRIESLGFEGALRYLGGIDGKAGVWAGVELGGGFTGKGKNDGSVSG